MHLHWLPVKFRLDFKIVLLVNKALHSMAPSYITDLLSTRTISCYQLRSDDQGFLSVPKTIAKTLGDRAFAHASVPYIRKSESIERFKTQLKTFLFNKAFNI